MTAPGMKGFLLRSYHNKLPDVCSNGVLVTLKDEKKIKTQLQNLEAIP